MAGAVQAGFEDHSLVEPSNPQPLGVGAHGPLGNQPDEFAAQNLHA